MKPKILFVAWYPYKASWLKRDIEILNEKYSVTVVTFASIKDVVDVIRTIPKIDLSFIWFGGKAAAITVFLSKIFRKKTIVVAAGADAARVPEINYGMSLDFFNRPFVQFSFQFADIILAVSKSTQKECIKNYHINPRKIIVVYHGFDKNIYKSNGEKKDTVLTISSISWATLKKKGIKTFVEAAKYLKEVHFILIGEYQDDSIKYLKSIASSNIQFMGYVSFPDLLDSMRKAKVYVQVSAHESFSSSLAEAMLCECVPVVTKRAALPEVVGNTGYYVKYNDAKETALTIKEALSSEKGKLARCRIIDNFNITNRKKNIQRIIDLLLS